jgi:hypothetical protein
MSDAVQAALQNAISNVVDDFQTDGERFWEERDIHWSLFHYLKQEPTCGEDYPTQLIRAEFPTLKRFGSTKPTRGHYDLVILDANTYFSPEIQAMRAQDSWGEFLSKIEIAIAIEIKLWLTRSAAENMANRVIWDIRKLTEKPNKVHNAYFLNFVQLDFEFDRMKKFYEQLRDYLSAQKSKIPLLKILCVPSTNSVQPDPRRNWL